jgi:MoaA/NifB/PqqE/SkfB family radical SAM enzyme
MFIHVEISTQCNFDCFYCAGRRMKPQRMRLPKFTEILAGIPPGQHTVCLQGEGEPLLHPEFWEMVALVRAQGHIPYTITNGSEIDADRIAELLPKIAISIDTLDAAEAERIGRKNLAGVLANVNLLLERMNPSRLVIMTVDYGQPLDELEAYIRSKGIVEHIVQPLQIKDDYRQSYPEISPPREEYTYRCRFLEHDLQRTYDFDGREYPCCYIKNPHGYESIVALRECLSRQEIPSSCRGCREILAGVGQTYRVADCASAVPNLSFVVPVKSRLPQLQKTLPLLARQTGAEVVVVDIDCPQKSADWVASAKFSNVHTVKLTNMPVFNAARARNVGAAHARGRWLCFLDADTLLEPNFVRGAITNLPSDSFAQLAVDAPGLVVVSREDFLRIDGYDEIFEGWGCEDNDLIVRLELLGRQRVMLTNKWHTQIEHDDILRTQHQPISNKWLSLRINGMYLQIKSDLARAQGIVSLPQSDLQAIYATVKQTILAAPHKAVDIRVRIPWQPDFRQPPEWQLHRDWVYRFEPLPAKPPVSTLVTHSSPTMHPHLS